MLKAQHIPRPNGLVFQILGPAGLVPMLLERHTPERAVLVTPVTLKGATQWSTLGIDRVAFVHFSAQGALTQIVSLAELALTYNGDTSTSARELRRVIDAGHFDQWFDQSFAVAIPSQQSSI